MDYYLNPQVCCSNIYDTIYGLFLICILSWAIISQSFEV